jgi:hypothetical protein
MVWQRFGPEPTQVEREARAAAFARWLKESGQGAMWSALRTKLCGPDTVLGDPNADNDEDAPGARFNECTDTIHEDEGDDDGED